MVRDLLYQKSPNIFCKTLKKDPNPIIRQKAAETLGKLRSEQALETLLYV
ncbi:hypothetical protein CWATWH0402_3666 [Crocosphaera watsonii WH 0402]|uniref:HEAT repeat domain-containing protein n=3 Tax=Crocosphaera watsonii TaxID=263511 RepID=T2JKV1_CROWT|nr:HEAT repeat domain-containing protein [Crocosphaera watsonii]EHJ11785.1 hypothetical protein CWATWH0003_3479 [Crocosphaera watsonii WH 0003]CCQ59444.1 hypothetical protein CWATWH0005_5230 [Crocosphaera watsonii WH 0005]CCQ65865.1 hypothetical protein CWATWH0402_3666 [Crocosphaera watsonii WH 0402]